ncbi:MAG: hypothetical protein J7L61_03175, partial [Thermoplasmata archaeon]|nr:hypothetical protein [Thermoplasmata archaeon]
DLSERTGDGNLTGWAAGGGRMEKGAAGFLARLPPWASSLLSMLFGLVVVLGAELLVRGAVDVAEMFGVSELLIGATLVAVGTSLPEMATTISAGLKKSHGIAIGNVIGSNIMNILGVLGLAALVRPIAADPRVVWPIMPFLFLLSLSVVPVVRMGCRRGEKAPEGGMEPSGEGARGSVPIFSRLVGLGLLASYIIFILFILIPL